jgi:hypothetical protein
MNSIIYFHVATINNYQEVFNEIYSKIINSGLNSIIDELNICIVGDGDLKIPHNTKVKVHRNSDIVNGEFFTLQKIEERFKQTDNDIKILYLHTKGVTTPENQCIIDWRKYMTYFNVIKYDQCLDALNSYDCCGVDYSETPTKHFSGNFWWSKSSYIKTLPSIETISNPSFPSILTTRHNAEFWLSMGNGKFKNLWSSNIPVFERHLHQYPDHNYIQ